MFGALGWSVTLLAIGLIAGILGFKGIAGAAAEIATALFLASVA